MEQNGTIRSSRTSPVLPDVHSSGTSPVLPDVENETTTVKMCPFYLNIYKRMRRWFGYTYPYWLTNMDEAELLKCILQLNMKPNMYLIFVNVACRIRLNNNAPTTRLEEYKKNNVCNDKIMKRKLYYDENRERIRIYNHHYNHIKTAFSGINLFKKNT